MGVAMEGGCFCFKYFGLGMLVGATFRFCRFLDRSGGLGWTVCRRVSRFW